MIYFVCYIIYSTLRLRTEDRLPRHIEEGRGFHDYRRYRAGRNYLMEKVILQGQPLPHGHAGYVIPEFP